MDFSHKGSASCFSSQCGLCNSCCGNTGGGTGRTWDHKNKYYYPGYVDEKHIYEEDNKYRNWWKYQDMLKIAQGKLEEVRDSYTEETPALTSELFAMREMGIPLEGGIRVQQGYLFRADHFNKMDNLSPEEFQGYVDKFPEFKQKMANLTKKYNYKYPEKPGSIPKYVDTENGRYILIEETGGQMCDDLECTMIGHCAIKNDEDAYNPGTEFFYSEMSEYYKTLPIYTKNKNHELCALCLLK
tara:strand:+ start:1362 stop:2087 length:726 start_codon:yes stop_codon:yes gene_type:complete